MSEETTRLGLLLSDDLIFTSRVAATARALGLTIKAARSVEALEALARHQVPAGVLIDLGNPGLDVPYLIAQMRSACPVMPRVVAYGSHVDAAGLRAARAAGCDIVLPRSAFVEQLPTALAEWLASSSD
ncbi:MAG: response regulator [Planctomycetes bacterium]|nr:response regulator [Planctomycetota bacterium]